MPNDENFWEDSTTDADFFSEDTPIEDGSDASEDVENKDGEATDPANADATKSTEPNFFEGETEGETSSEDSPEGETDDPKPTGNVGLFHLLKEKGYITSDTPEGEEGEKEVTEDEAESLITSGIDKYIEDSIKDKLITLPKDVQHLIQYSLNGGDLQSYIDNMESGIRELPTDLKLDNADDQKFALRVILREEGYDEDTIDTQIETLADTNKLDTFSKSKYAGWKAKTDKANEKLIKDQEAIRLENIAKLEERKKDIAGIIKAKKAIGEIPIPQDMHKVLPSYLEDKTVKLQNGSSITQLQKELFYDLPKNKEAMIQMAVLMKSRNEDGTFNFDKIAKNINTKITKTVKENIRRGSTSIPKSAGNSSNSGRPLADYF